MVGVAVFSLVLLVVVVSLISAQEGGTWKESFRLGYNYEITSGNGPLNWGDIGIDDSELYEYVDHKVHDLRVPDNQCDEPRRPSPLNLSPTTYCADTHEMLTRKIKEYDCKKSDVTFDITPYGLKAYFPEDDDQCLRPTIDISNRYPFLFHLAWMEVHVRAEHVIDGRRYDGEIQMYHLGTEDHDYLSTTVSVLLEANAFEDNEEFQWLLNQWQSVRDAMDKGVCDAGGRRMRSSRRRPQMAADNAGKNRTFQRPTKEELNVLHYGAANPRLNDAGDFIQTMDDLQLLREKVLERQHTHPLMNSEEESSRRKMQADTDCIPDRFGRGCAPLERRNLMFPYTLWPSNHYYGYRGGVTYPPCSDIVNWRILDVPLRISRNQYRQLVSLSNSYKNHNCKLDSDLSLRGENVRPLRSRGQMEGLEQEVFHCTLDDFTYVLYDPQYN